MSAIADAMRTPSRPLLVPLVYRMAARLEQVDVTEMLADPAAAAFVLGGAQRLLGLPAVVDHYNLGLELEAHGAHVRRDETGVPVAADGCPAAFTPDALEVAPLATVLDTAARLAVELHREADVLGVLTGPVTLQRLAGREIEGLSEWYAALARCHADAGVAAVLVAEADTGDAQAVAASCRELCNVCRFYAIPSMLLTGNDAAGSGFDVVAARAVPPAALLRAPQADAGSFTLARGVLLTAGEVPEHAEPGTVAAWIRTFGAATAGGGR